MQRRCINILVSVLLMGSSLFSQFNLVPNNSFETYTVCPSWAAETAVGWVSFRGTPDYFNVCATSTLVGVPNNFPGYQMPYNGNAYAGLITYGGSYREYLATPLTQTLNTGTKYFVSAYISRMDSSSSTSWACSSNKFSFKFGTVAGTYSINNLAHIYTNTVITDAINWTKISGSFIADSAYQYLALGNFFTNTNTTLSGCSYSNSTVYYYVDDVCVSSDSNTCNLITGIKNTFKNWLIVYPNPVDHVFIIEDIERNVPYIIKDIFGTIILEGIPEKKKTIVDVSDIPNGIYFLLIQGEKFKILINHL